MSDYPEHDKMAKIADKSQKIGEFLDWLNSEKDIELKRWSEEHDEYVSVFTSTTVLLAEFFDIDLTKIEAEKRAMLDRMRELDDAG